MMMKHIQIYNNIILSIAKEKLNCVRQRYYPLSYYLNMFNFMQNDSVKWKSLENFKIYKPKKEGKHNNKGFHYKSIQNEFNRWANLNIFVEAHNRFLRKYYFKLKPHLLKFKINLSIDTTCIWNKYGVEYIGVHPEYRKKKATKIGSIVDSDGDIISILNFIVNETHVKENNYEYIKKTFMHDVKIMQDLFDNILIHFDKRKNIYCGADKSFITKNIIKCQSKDVNIITPKRKRSDKQIKKLIKLKTNEINKINELRSKLKDIKDKEKGKRYLFWTSKIKSLQDNIEELKEDQKTKYTNPEKEILGERYKVEDNYKNIKKSERIVIRKDRKIKTFMSFIFMDELKRLITKYYDKIIDQHLYFV